MRLLEEELAEIHRILLEMTRRIGEQSREIVTAVDVLAELELQFAKARFADDYGCVAVTLLSDEAESALVLRNARHPVLERNLRARRISVVPMTLELNSAASAADHQRAEYGWKDGCAEDGRPARAGGTGRYPGIR